MSKGQKWIAVIILILILLAAIAPVAQTDDGAHRGALILIWPFYGPVNGQWQWGCTATFSSVNSPERFEHSRQMHDIRGPWTSDYCQLVNFGRRATYHVAMGVIMSYHFEGAGEGGYRL